MTIPTAVRAFWEAFQATVDFDASSRFYAVFHFDDNDRTANKLARLVLLGTKRATAGLLWSFEAANKPLPKPGDLSVVTNWKKEPLCIIETKIVTIVPFEDVTESFAAMEGEGDKSLRYWRDTHWSYFSRECQPLGKEPSRRMPVACEQFEVVYSRRSGSH